MENQETTTEADETTKKAAEQEDSKEEETKVEAAEAEQTEAEAEQTEAEAEDFKNKFYYLAAEMENMKKRFEREKSNLLTFGSEKILTDLLEVIDNLERTVSAIQDDEDAKIKNIVTGINMVQSMFLTTLKKFGLEQVEAVGKIFDPNFHEAMSQQEVEGKKDNEIIQEYQKGYTLNGRLIRASKVIVAKAKEN